VNLGQPVFIEAKDGGSGGDNWTAGAISRAKLQSNHHQQQPGLLQARCPSCLPTNSVKAVMGQIASDSSVSWITALCRFFYFKYFYTFSIEDEIWKWSGVCWECVICNLSCNMCQTALCHLSVSNGTKSRSNKCRMFSIKNTFFSLFKFIVRLRYVLELLLES